MDLTLEVTQQDGAWIVTAVGEVDVHTAPRLRAALLEAEAGDPNTVVVDLTSVPFMDSTGLGVLVGGLARARESGHRLVLAGATDRIGRLLRLTGLDQQFESATDVATAVRST